MSTKQITYQDDVQPLPLSIFWKKWVQLRIIGEKVLLPDPSGLFFTSKSRMLK